MTTTENPATPLPFLLPAANLAIGDTIRTDSVTGVIRSITRYVPDVHTFAFVGDSRTFTCKPGELVERTGHTPVEVLNDVVTALTELAEEWDLIVASHRRIAGEKGEYDTDGHALLSQADERVQCVTAVRAILARLQPAQPDNAASEQPECGEYGPNNGVCGQPVIDGICPDHGEVGPPVES
jgi:hypothetical protein